MKKLIIIFLLLAGYGYSQDTCKMYQGRVEGTRWICTDTIYFLCDTAFTNNSEFKGSAGGSPIEVAFYDWKGATTNEILSDKSSMGNNLTGTNIDINDRIKVKGKFK